MREIKFRAWNKEAKRMIDLKANTSLALNAEMNTQMAIQGFDGLFIPFHKDVILMQYTGLKDKNGKEIYEGDIVNLLIDILFEEVEKIGVIEMDSDYMAGWVIDFPMTGLTIAYCDPKISDSSEFEIIGNIYENPKLVDSILT